MIDDSPDDRIIRTAALQSVVQLLTDCQAVLDGYGLSLEAAHLDLALQLVRQQLALPDPPLDELMKRFGLY
jgi:hypothetical protein